MIENETLDMSPVDCQQVEIFVDMEIASSITIDKCLVHAANIGVLCGSSITITIGRCLCVQAFPEVPHEIHL